ncbi:MAG: LysM domain-containing protein [Chloroflexota bacterium]|nr:LysM domain-containing protein [Chloroflexota bacterium]
MLRTRKILVVLSVVLALQLFVVPIGHAAPPSGNPSYHHVRWGETLFSIGRQYGVNPYDIARANNLWNPNRIYACQWLRIPKPGPVGRCHHVKSGETLFSIGRKYNVNPYAIARANNLWNPDCIYACQCLRIPWGPPYPGPCCDP